MQDEVDVSARLLVEGTSVDACPTIFGTDQMLSDGCSSDGKCVDMIGIAAMARLSLVLLGHEREVRVSKPLITFMSKLIPRAGSEKNSLRLSWLSS